MDVISLIDGQISIAVGVIQCTLCSELCLLIVLPCVLCSAVAAGEFGRND